ncbi:MAG: secretin N-terminal domain-containing protein, partial [Planctomycetota bacterium]
TDYAYRMDQIQKVLDMIDVPGEAKEYEFRTLKFMKPSEMVPKLEELAGKLQDVSLQISTPTAAAPKTRSVTTRDPKTGRTTTKQVPITTSTPAAAKTPEPDAVYIDTDDRTNRILMAGKVEQIELINELIDALDVPQYDLKVVREYIIENVEAGDVIDVLNELALATVTVSTPTRDSKTTPKTSKGDCLPKHRRWRSAVYFGPSGNQFAAGQRYG